MWYRFAHHCLRNYCPGYYRTRHDVLYPIVYFVCVVVAYKACVAAEFGVATVVAVVVLLE